MEKKLTIIRRKESATFQALANALAAATGGVAAFTLIYPLDVIRCRLQAAADNPITITNNNRLGIGNQSPLSPSYSDDMEHKLDHSPDPNIEEEEIEEEDELIKYNNKNKNHNKKSAKTKKKTSAIEASIKLIYSTEGVAGFYKALGSALIGIFYSEWIYFFAVTFVKYSFYGQREVKPTQNLLASILAGLCCVFATTPYWTAQTQLMLQSKKKSKFDEQVVNQHFKRPTKGNDSPSIEEEIRYDNIFHALRCIAKKKGIAGLYAGVGAAILLVSNPIIQYVCYEEFVSVFKKLQKTSHLSSLTYFLCGALAKAIATYITYPLQVMKTQLQKRDSKYKTMSDYFQFMSGQLKQGDIAPLYAGLYAKLFQTVSNAAIKFMIYEKILGLVKTFVRLVRKLLAMVIFQKFVARHN